MATRRSSASPKRARSNSEFAILLKRYRLAAGLSQETLAGRASLSLQAISALERGFRKAPYKTTVRLIAEALGLSHVQQRAFEAAAERARLEARPESPPHNLPRLLTRFVGSDASIAEITRLAALWPLLTIVGPAGVGKTRAAIQAGYDIAATRVDGLWFVDFSVLNDPQLVPNAIAAALGIVEAPGAPVLDTIVGYLCEKSAVLIFDNCEHLIEPVREAVARLTRDCSLIGIITTSREALRIAGEHIYRMPALAVPPAAANATAAQLEEYSSVALFVDRARAVADWFVLNAENAPAVAEICRRVEGLPLAIELAAARCSVLAPNAIAGRLDDPFALLRDPRGAAASPHSTMRTTMDWSYGLLAAQEQQLLERLSVFAGGCTLEAIVEICGAEPLRQQEVLDLLTSLVNKSLVAVDVKDRRTRYRLLQLTREYARERLDARGESALMARRHADWYLALATRNTASWYHLPDAEWLPAAEDELDNWRGALAWARMCDERLIVMQLAGSLAWVWYTFALGEGTRWIAAAIAVADETAAPVALAQLHVAEAELHGAFGQYVPVLAAAERAMALLSAEAPAALTVRARQLAGRALILLGNIGQGESLIESSVRLATELGLRRLLAMGQKELGTAYSLRGEAATARRLYESALSIYRANGWRQQSAVVAGHLAELEFEAGDAAEALSRIQEALAAHRALKNERFAVNDLCNMSAYLIALDRYDEAETCVRSALQGARDLGLQVLEIWVLQHLAALIALRPHKRGKKPADVCMRAARLTGYVDASIVALGAAREYTEQQEYDRILVALEQVLGAGELARLMSEGRAWDATLARTLENEILVSEM